MRKQYKLAILTNIMAPYRLPIYRILANEYNLNVIFSGWEDNRDFWEKEYLKEKYYHIKRAWGFRFKIPRKKYGKLFDYWYLHINPGYLSELIKIQPDAVITHEMGFRTLMALLYGSIFRKPVWVSWEGTVHTEINIGILKTMIRRLIARWTKRWISYGETSTEYLLSLGIKKQNILQIQNCVDEQWFNSSNIYPILDIQPKPVVLYAGRLVGLKGLKHYFHIASKLQSEGYCFSSLIVGGGPDRDKLKKQVENLNLKNVYFHPPVKPSAMAGIYKSADLLIFPTLQDVWGLVVNEAIWSGLPVVCSQYAGCARELLPEENIFNPINAEDFLTALKRALDGKISPPDGTKLKTCQEVSQMITNEIDGVLKPIKKMYNVPWFLA